MTKTKMLARLFFGVFLLTILSGVFSPTVFAQATVGPNDFQDIPEDNGIPRANFFTFKILDRNRIQVTNTTLVDFLLYGDEQLRTHTDGIYFDNDLDSTFNYKRMGDTQDDRLSNLSKFDDSDIRKGDFGDLDYLNTLGIAELNDFLKPARFTISIDEDRLDGAECPNDGAFVFTATNGGANTGWKCSSSTSREEGLYVGTKFDTNSLYNFNITFRYSESTGHIHSTDDRFEFEYCENGNKKNFQLLGASCNDADYTLSITEAQAKTLNREEFTLSKNGVQPIKVVIAGPAHNTAADVENLIAAESAIDDTTTCAGESGSSFGWILCPVIEHAYEFLDWLYRNFLEPVLRLNIDKAEQLTEIWSGFRLIANMFFVIAFIIVIYSAATGNIMSAYDVRKLLPRLFIVAILVQLSLFLSITALQISNLAGAGIQDIMLMPLNGNLISIPEVLGGNDGDGPSDFMAGFFGGVASAVSGIIVIISLTIALVGSLSGIIVLIGVFLIRNLGILILIVLSPIAFALAILPGTEGYFRKWWKWYFGLLMMYPIMAAFLASGQLLASIITESKMFGKDGVGTFINSIIATIVLFVPFFIAPKVLQFAGAAMGTVSGIMNGIKDGGAKFMDRESVKRTRATVKGRAFSSANRFGDTGSTSGARRGVGRLMGTKAMTRRAGYGISGMESIEQDDVKAAAVLLGQKTSGMESQQEEEYLRSVSGKGSKASTASKRAAMARQLINKDIEGLELAFAANDSTSSGNRMIERFKADNADALNSVARPLLLGQKRTESITDPVTGDIVQKQESRELAGARMFTGANHEQMHTQGKRSFTESARIIEHAIGEAHAVASSPTGTAADAAYEQSLQADLNKMLNTYTEIFTDDSHQQLRGRASASKGAVDSILTGLGRDPINYPPK